MELGGVSGEGTVGLNVDGNNLNLSFPNGVAKADVALTLVEAQGWVKDANGNVVLTANVPTVRSYSSWRTSAECGAN